MRIDLESKKRLKEDPDFIWAPEYDFSLIKCLEANPKGIPIKKISAFLSISPSEAKEFAEEAEDIIKTTLQEA